MTTSGVARYALAIVTAVSMPVVGHAEKKKPKSSWVKSCAKTDLNKQRPKKVCLTFHEQLDKRTAEPHVFVAIQEVVGQQRQNFVIMLPPTTDKKGGVVVRFDEEPNGHKLNFSKCVECGCIAGIGADETLYAKLKRSNFMRLYVDDRMQKARVLYPVSLIGFTKAFTSPPVSLRSYNKAYNQVRYDIFLRQGSSRKEALDRVKNLKCSMTKMQ